MAEVGPSQAKVSQATPIDGHVGTGGTNIPETSLACEAALWLEAGTKPTCNPWTGGPWLRVDRPDSSSILGIIDGGWLRGVLGKTFQPLAEGRRNALPEIGWK